MTLLTGWGRTAATAATVEAARDPVEVARLVRRAGPRGVLARGSGCSYGDAAGNGGGTVIRVAGGQVAVDPAVGTMSAAAGTTFADLLRATLPHGLVLPVLPGTARLTLGGAVAADVHGKNHPVDGSLGRHLLDLDLVTADGRCTRLTPTGPDPDAFWATVGGMGLTGVVTRATVRLHRVSTSRMRVATSRTPDLAASLALFDAPGAPRYAVAWVDCLARGRSRGRGVWTGAEHAEVGDLAAADRADPLSCPAARRLSAPPLPGGPLRPATVRAFNAVYHRRAPTPQTTTLQSLASYFQPLDAVAGWNRLYGPAGFVQYQAAVPAGREDVLADLLGRLADSGTAPFLAVLKRLGAVDPAQGCGLSFPLPGWTLAVDLPLGPPRLARLLDGLDDLVAGAGGRVYLAKDARLRPDLLPAMYPQLPSWRAVRDRLDPHGCFASDLGRRLGLTAAGTGRPGAP